MVVTGPAASGKTNLLVNLALEHRDPPTLLSSLGGYAHGPISLLTHLARALAIVPTNSPEPIDEGVLADMIRRGKVTLILDGLDELARMRGEEAVKVIMFEVSRLVEGGTPRMVIACRDHIFDRLDQGKVFEAMPPYQRVQLKGSGIEASLRAKLQQMFPELSSYEPTAVSLMAHIPLFYGILCRDPSQAKRLLQCRTESDFWSEWISFAIERPPLRLERADALRGLGEIAVKMLEYRTDDLTEDCLREQLPLVERLSGDTYPLLVKECGNKWRFIHQTAREYVLAHNMADGFRDPGADSVLTKTPSFDYEGVETYAFVSELLKDTSVEGIATQLGATLCLPIDVSKWNNFTRNYFELLGMLGPTDECANLAIDQAKLVLEDSADRSDHRSLFLTRFNAARCLVRLHPSAPAPYFRHAPHYSWRDNPDGYTIVYGYAVRGFHEETHTIGSYPPEAFRPNHDKRLSSRQEEISNCLLAVLEKLMEQEELHPNGEFLKVNVTHALLRWLAPGSGKTVPRVRRLLGSSRLGTASAANLRLALCVNGAATASDWQFVEKDGLVLKARSSHLS
jgi:hypothetical protein